jgi:hypothetical protein
MAARVMKAGGAGAHLRLQGRAEGSSRRMSGEARKRVSGAEETRERTFAAEFGFGGARKGTGAAFGAKRR